MALGDEVLREAMENCLLECWGSEIRVAVLVPPGIHETSIRFLAQKWPFDLCFVTLNNIRFIQHEPKSARLQSSVTLVRDLVQLYSKPVVTFYGWPDDPGYPDRILAAGAAAIYRVPFRLEPLRRLLMEKLDLPQ